MPGDVLFVVVPCYNEEEMLTVTPSVLKAKLVQLAACGAVSNESKVLFVDDGSQDKTWQMITELCSTDESFCGIKLSRNCGHQNAMLAGMEVAIKNCDVVITIDADLQDDVDTFDEMIRKYHDGSEIVYGVRTSRETDTFFKRTSAGLFYKLMNFLGAETK